MLRVGLSGRIAGGKSEAAKCFSELGVPVIDADAIARRLTAPGSDELRAITEAFGAEILNPDGSLNRAALRQRVFDNDADRLRLNAILHPSVRRQIEKEIKKLHAPYCIIVIPLLVEAGMQDLVDYTIVVDCDEQTRVQRVTARDRCDEEQARKIIKSQDKEKKMLEVADVVVDNAGTMENLKAKIGEIHPILLREAENHGQ